MASEQERMPTGYGAAIINSGGVMLVCMRYLTIDEMREMYPILSNPLTGNRVARVRIEEVVDPTEGTEPK